MANKKKPIESQLSDKEIDDLLVDVAKDCVWLSSISAPTHREVKDQLDPLIKLNADLCKKLKSIPDQLKICVDTCLSKPEIIGINGDYSFVTGISSYIKSLKFLSSVFQYQISEWPKTNGRKFKVLKQAHILKMIAKVFQATGKTLTAPKYDRSSDAYSGDLYDFILSVKPRLKQLGVKLGAKNSIGRTLITVVKEIKNEHKTSP